MEINPYAVAGVVLAGSFFATLYNVFKSGNIYSGLSGDEKFIKFHEKHEEVYLLSQAWRALSFESGSMGYRRNADPDNRIPKTEIDIDKARFHLWQVSCANEGTEISDKLDEIRLSLPVQKHVADNNEIWDDYLKTYVPSTEGTFQQQRDELSNVINSLSRQESEYEKALEGRHSLTLKDVDRTMKRADMPTIVTVGSAASLLIMGAYDVLKPVMHYLYDASTALMR